MRRLLRLGLVAAAIGALGLFGSGSLSSANQAWAASECTGTVTGTVNGGLVVHAGDNCNVQGATVHGGIRMDGGTLAVCGSTVSGAVDINVTGANSATSGVDLGNAEAGCAGNTFNGTVSISGVQGHAPLGDELDSSIEIDGCFNPGGTCQTINGSLKLTNNGLIEVEATHVTGSCQASGNAAVTNSGFPDQIDGSSQGQCVGLNVF